MFRRLRAPRPTVLPAPLALSLSLALLAAGCTVGPDYRSPPAVASGAIGVATFAHAPRDVGAAAPPVAAWWRTLGDPQLDQLIESALRRSPSIRAARARVRQARAGLHGRQADLLPVVSGSAAALRTRSPDLSTLAGSAPSGSGRGPLSLYFAGFDASWEIDIFGGTRRAIEAAAAEADASDAELADAHVQLAAEVAHTYIDLRARQASLAQYRASVQLEADILELTRQRWVRGAASELEVERLVTQLENTRAQIAPAEADIVDALDQLSLLTGGAPGALDDRLALSGPLPTLPEDLAAGDPAALLKARPDIRAAERRLASRTAQIGAQQADWFPKVSLLGSLGFSARDPGHLVRKTSGTWLALPRLQWNVLDFGRIGAAVDGAEGGRDEAEADYERVVLAALRDADAALSRYGYQRQNVVVLRRAQASAERVSTLQQQRYRAGTASLLEWLDVERTRVRTEQDRITGDAIVLRNYVSLQKSLGLGWQVAI
jgi:NodT family efflux transporter outer membrane factor (OMF) lipoprotein